MAAKLSPLNLDHAIELYLAGQPQAEILAATGISASTLHRERNRRGIPPRGALVIGDEAIESYRAGESEYSLGNRLGISRSAVRRCLIEQGVQPRDRSEAGITRAKQMSPEARSAQVAAAHAAVLGVTVTEERKVAHAKALQRIGRIEPGGEQLMADWLTDRGWTLTPQRAIGRYNVDLAEQPVAVEILGGGWHALKATHATRTPYILDRGWAMLFVWNYEGRSALTERAADYATAFRDQVRRDPALIGEYRVIAGDGETLSRGRVDDGEFTLVPPPRGRIKCRP